MEADKGEGNVGECRRYTLMSELAQYVQGGVEPRSGRARTCFCGKLHEKYKSCLLVLGMCLTCDL